MKKTNKQLHTAKYHQVDSKLPKIIEIIEGNFSIDFSTNGLNFECNTQNVEFFEVENALIRLRDEVQRQLDNKKLCPSYQEKGESTDEDL